VPRIIQLDREQIATSALNERGLTVVEHLHCAFALRQIQTRLRTCCAEDRARDARD